MKDEQKHSIGKLHPSVRRVCFVTGTRAEFGLMGSVLDAIAAHPKLELQLIVTGMHLHTRHGKSIDVIREQGRKIDDVVPWTRGDSPVSQAQATGAAMSKLAAAFDRLETDIVLVTGDRIEAFAAASAGHVSQRVVAHIHGGDRAPGQVDDSLRHAITKLAHIHFPATQASKRRILRLGEDPARVHCVGSPGLDGIQGAAAGASELKRSFPDLQPRRFALIVLHPVDPSDAIEHQRADAVLDAVLQAGIEQMVVVYPNSDPGARGIIRCWRGREAEITYLLKDVPRRLFLGLMRDAAVLVGNSSSGIIEAASFGTPVVDIGPRQLGRERSQNVRNVPYSQTRITEAVKKIFNNGHPRRWRGRNVYGDGEGTGKRLASILAGQHLSDPRILRKLIAY